MITVYGRATSSNVQAVMWCIAELGLDYDRKDYGHHFGGVDSPQYRSMNPNGLVPTIRDGDGDPIWESAAIIRYLAAKYGSGPFWPPDPETRVNIDQWAEWGKVTLSPAFTVPIFWSRVRTAAQDRDAAALVRAIERFESLLGILAAQLEGKLYVCGPDLTVADIIVGHLLFRYFDIDIERSPMPVIEDYYARLAQRPAYQEHVMVDYSILRVEGA